MHVAEWSARASLILVPSCAMSVAYLIKTALRFESFAALARVGRLSPHSNVGAPPVVQIPSNDQDRLGNQHSLQPRGESTPRQSNHMAPLHLLVEEEAMVVATTTVVVTVALVQMTNPHRTTMSLPMVQVATRALQSCCNKLWLR